MLVRVCTRLPSLEVVLVAVVAVMVVVVVVVVVVMVVVLVVGGRGKFKLFTGKKFYLWPPA